MPALNFIQGRSFRSPDSSEPTRHLFVANCGTAAGISIEDIKDLFERLHAAELQLYGDRRSIVFASFATAQDAEQAMAVLLSAESKQRYRAFTVKFAELSEEQVWAAGQFCLQSCLRLSQVELAYHSERQCVKSVLANRMPLRMNNTSISALTPVGFLVFDWFWILWVRRKKRFAISDILCKLQPTEKLRRSMKRKFCTKLRERSFERAVYREGFTPEDQGFATKYKERGLRALMQHKD